MRVQRAVLIWDGPAEDVVWLLTDPMPELWQADPIDATGRVSLLRALDEGEAPTEELAGVEVLDFLDFEAWETLPTLPVRWAIGDDEPRSLVEVLQTAQAAWRAQSAGRDGTGGGETASR
jgi:hypothetical protein